MVYQHVNRWLVVFLAALLVAVAGCGSSSSDDTATEETSTSDASVGEEAGHDHSDHDHGGTDGFREWTGSPAPEVHLTLEEDGSGGTVLAIDSPGFTFTPASVIEPVPGEGHAHLYVDGDLLTMIYRRSYVLPQLPAGARELTVTLSTNDHLEYAVDGKPMAASILLTASDAATGGSGDGAGAVGPPDPPVVSETAAVETIEGVVVAVDGGLTRTMSFTLLVDAGDQILFFPTATATFHGGPISHIRDHLTSGSPVIVEYAVLEDGTYAAISVTDH